MRSAERSKVTAMVVDANAPSAVDTAIIQRPAEGATSPYPMPRKLYNHEKSRIRVSPKSNESESAGACSNSSSRSCMTTRSPEALYNKGVMIPPVHRCKAVLSMSLRCEMHRVRILQYRVYEYMSSDAGLSSYAFLLLPACPDAPHVTPSPLEIPCSPFPTTSYQLPVLTPFWATTSHPSACPHSISQTHSSRPATPRTTPSRDCLPLPGRS